MSSPYGHTSFGVAFFIELVIVFAVVAPLLMFITPPESLMVVYGSMVAVFLLFAVLFYNLTVEVSDGQLRLRFGLGIIQKKYDIKDFESTEVSRSPWYLFYSIRGIPGGWLYNVSGYKSVDIHFKGGGKIRVGTNQPEALKRALDAAMKRA